MSKSALGRGLGDLMGEQKMPSNVPLPSTPRKGVEENGSNRTDESVDVATPGVETLLRGKTETPKAEDKNPSIEPVKQASPPVKWSFLKWVLLIADLLLIVPMSLFVLTRSTKINFLEGTLCVVTFSFAAGLGCLAFYIHRHEEK
jgi:hypothetical protein